MQKPPSFKISYLWDYYPIPIHIWHTYSLHNKEKPPKKINPMRFFFIHVKLILKLSIFSWILMEFLIESKKPSRVFSIKKGNYNKGRGLWTLKKKHQEGPATTPAPPGIDSPTNTHKWLNIEAHFWIVNRFQIGCSSWITLIVLFECFSAYDCKTSAALIHSSLGSPIKKNQKNNRTFKK
jgi:hypothetical protein